MFAAFQKKLMQFIGPLKIITGSYSGTVLELNSNSKNSSQIIDVRVDDVSKFIITNTGDIYSYGDYNLEGNFRLVGNGTVFDDLMFPATGINPSGSPTAPVLDNNNGWLQFDPNIQQVIAIQVQLPHRWKEESLLYPHIHWSKSDYAAGNVVWQLEYKWLPIGDVMDTDWTTTSISTPISATPDTNTARKHLISSFPEIDTTNKHISDMIIMKLSRLATDSADTYSSNALMFQFDIHYEIDSFGSNIEFSK